MAVIINRLNNTFISGTSSDYSIKNYGSKVTISSGKGNDTISNVRYYSYSASSVSISTGAGNDSVYNSGDSATINTGAGNDYVFKHVGHYTTINTGAGNDSILNYSYYATIDTGAGNDLISLNAYSEDNVIEYKSGDGNDKIIGFNEDDTLSISGGSYSKETIDNDIILTVGDGKITLEGATSLSAVYIAGSEKVTTPATLLTVTDSTKSPLTLDAAVKNVNASSRTTAIKITGNALANSITGGSGADTIFGGKDVIFGFDDNGTLTLDNLDFSATCKNSALTFKVDSTASAITLKDFTASTFHINNDTYQISGGKLVVSD